MMKYSIVFILLALIITGCDKFIEKRPLPRKVPDLTLRDLTYEGVSDTTYEPPFSVPDIESITVGNDTLQLVRIYNNNIAYSQRIGNNDEGVLLYRDAVLNFITSKNDTISIRKADFKEHIHSDDYDVMILQSVHGNMKIKKGIVPLMIMLCMPDSDFCYYFDVDISGENLVIKEINEDDLY